MKFNKILAAVAAVGCLMAGSAQAVFISPDVTLDTLLTGGTFTVGDKIFSDFSATCSHSALGVCDPHGVFVHGLPANAQGFGIQFSGAINAAAGNSADLSLGFTVRVSDPTKFLIHSAHLLIAGHNGGVGGQAQTSETLFDASHSTAYSMFASVPTKLFDDINALTFNTASLEILKNILVVGGTDTADESIIRQRFDQISLATPEPGSIALAGLALMGLFAVRRAKKV